MTREQRHFNRALVCGHWASDRIGKMGTNHIMLKVFYDTLYRTQMYCIYAFSQGVSSGLYFRRTVSV